MRKFKLKVLTSALFLGIAYCLCCGQSKAASATVSASSKNVSVGDKVTINVSIDAATWNVYVSGAVSDSIVGYNNDLANEKTTKSYTLDTSKAGTYTVSLSGTVKDGSGKSNASDSVIVTVAEKAPTTTSNNNSSNNTNNNTSNNNNSNSNNKQQEKEPTFKSVNETVYATGNVNIRKSYSTSSDKIGYLEEGKSVTRTGVGDNGWSKVTYNGGTAYINTSFLTTEKPEEKSSDKALKSLEVKPEGLTPAFSPETTAYTLEVTSNVEKIEVKAVANDEKAKVAVTGNEELKYGENTVKVTVTAEDGTTKDYTINVKRPEKSALSLSTLKINGCTMTPAFSPEVYEYNVELKNSNLTSLDLSAIPAIDGAKVEITGNDNLKNGTNTITITVKSEDGTEKSVYKVHVKKTSAAAPASVKTENKKSKLPFYIGFGAIALLILLLIIIIVKDRRDREYDDEDDEDYQDENNDGIFGYAPRSEKKYSQESSKGDIQEDDFKYNPYNEVKSEEPKKQDDNSYDGLFGTMNNVDESFPQANVSDNLTDAMKDYKLEEERDRSYNNFFDNESDTHLDSDLDYDYKPKRSKGKHSK